MGGSISNMHTLQVVAFIYNVPVPVPVSVTKVSKQKEDRLEQAVSDSNQIQIDRSD